MYPLTTDNESSSQKFDLTMNVMNRDSNDKVNIVVSQLVQNVRKLVKTECNIELFTTFLKLNISTRAANYLSL